MKPPQLGQTPPPELETTVPDAEILPINCMLLILQTGTGADSATPVQHLSPLRRDKV